MIDTLRVYACDSLTDISAFDRSEINGLEISTCASLEDQTRDRWKEDNEIPSDY